MDMADLTPPDPTTPDPVIAAHPIGQVVRATLGPQGLATATYDETKQWRFRLSRVWDSRSPRCAFVMLNPSTATEEVLDPTVAGCVKFAKTWGYGALEVANIFAYRATKPADMKNFQSPVGDGNDEAIKRAVESADFVIAAWGNHGAHLDRGTQVRALLDDSGKVVHLLRQTKRGHPGHPLYVRRDTAPVAWL